MTHQIKNRVHDLARRFEDATVAYGDDRWGIPAQKVDEERYGECDCCNKIDRLFYIERTWICGHCAEEITNPKSEDA